MLWKGIQNGLEYAKEDRQVPVDPVQAEGRGRDRTQCARGDASVVDAESPCVSELGLAETVEGLRCRPEEWRPPLLAPDLWIPFSGVAKRFAQSSRL